VSCAKTAEPIEMRFGMWAGGSIEPCIRWGAHWRHLANTCEEAMWPYVKLLSPLVVAACLAVMAVALVKQNVIDVM